MVLPLRTLWKTKGMYWNGALFNFLKIHSYIYMYVCTKGLVDGSMDGGWMDGCIDRCMYGGMDGW